MEHGREVLGRKENTEEEQGAKIKQKLAGVLAGGVGGAWCVCVR